MEAHTMLPIHYPQYDNQEFLGFLGDLQFSSYYVGIPPTLPGFELIMGHDASA